MLLHQRSLLPGPLDGSGGRSGRRQQCAVDSVASSRTVVQQQRRGRRGRPALLQVAQQEADVATSSSGSGRVLVVGGGPAGCLCASLLAQRGFTVDVFEQRQEPVASDARSHRSYPMVLSSRSMEGCREAGLQLPLPQPQAAVFMPRGKLDMLWEDSTFCKQYIVDRVMFGGSMYSAVKQRHGDKINWHFGHALEHVDFERRQATFTSTSDPSGALSQGASSPSLSTTAGSATTTTTSVDYELLVGADGAGSRVRQLMQGVIPGLSVDLIFANRATYKTYHGLGCIEEGMPGGSAPAELVPGFQDHEHSRYLYTFNAKDQPTLVMWRQADGKASGMLTRARSYDAETLRSQISTAYPQIPRQWVDSIVVQTSEASGQPPSPFGKLMACSQLHGPRTVLLGDAGHPMTSTLAQGCNLALESVRVFAATLDASGSNLDVTPEAFTAARLNDVRAMQDIEYMQILTSNAPGAQATAVQRATAKATMLGSVALSLAMHKLMPGVYRAPVYLLDGLRDARVPYAQVLATMRMHAAMLGAALGGLTLAAAKQLGTLVTVAAELPAVELPMT